MTSAGAGDPAGYVREFTRHAGDVLLNLAELRHRRVLTDVTLLVGGRPLMAHKAVLAACSGFFYSIFLGQGGGELNVLPLPSSIQPGGFQALLDFMYTSRLPLTPASVPAVLAAATYLQMEHVVGACHRFIQASYDRVGFKTFPSLAGPEPLDTPTGPLDASGPAPTGAPCLGTTGSRAKECGGAPLAGERGPPASPSRSEGHPASPRESSGCAPDPKACNWKKYKFIILNALRGEGPAGGGREPPQTSSPPQPPTSGDRGSGCHWEDGARSGSWRDSGPLCRPHPSSSPCPMCTEHLETGALVRPPHPHTPEGQPHPPAGAGPYSCRACKLGLGEEEVGEEEKAGGPLATSHDIKPFKCHLCRSAFRYKGNLASHRAIHTGEKPYHCGVCGAQFNRPANLKTHSRIHSGEKPYKCETCGSSFVQVAHLRAHVLIHTGEKPYPCETCGTRFRHLQTLKSHIRIHTGEKPYHCESCCLHFRHKSQLRLHLRQKHGAVTNTKIRYKILAGPYCAPC